MIRKAEMRQRGGPISCRVSGQEKRLGKALQPALNVDKIEDPLPTRAEINVWREHATYENRFNAGSDGSITIRIGGNSGIGTGT
jgi:hypothetical protein